MYNALYISIYCHLIYFICTYCDNKYTLPYNNIELFYIIVCNVQFLTFILVSPSSPTRLPTRLDWMCVCVCVCETGVVAVLTRFCFYLPCHAAFSCLFMHIILILLLFLCCVLLHYHKSSMNKYLRYFLGISEFGSIQHAHLR